MPQTNKNILWIFVLLLCVLPAFAKNDQKRFALVIGNHSYQTPNGLKNPDFDTLDISLALYDLDFEVIRVFNQTKSQTELLIESFTNKLAQSKGIGLIYYSGIGIQSNGENYLVPVDAGFETVENTVKTSVSMNFLLSKLKNAGNVQNLILLDPKETNNSLVKWKSYSINLANQGFVKVSPPENSVIVYSADFRKTAPEVCASRNGFFAEAFLKQLEKPNLEFNQLIKNVSVEISLKTDNWQKVVVDGVMTKPVFLVNKKNKLDSKRIKQKKREENSLADLFDRFKSEIKCRCGQRDGKLTTGKKIIEKFGGDELNKDVIDYVKKLISIIEKEDPVCRRNNRYNFAYKTKNWSEFFSISKEIIAKEGENPLVLDVMLTLVSVGYDQSVAKVDAYNNDTLNYAKQAIQKLEAGGTSLTGNFGTFNGFKTRTFTDGKNNSLNWMNYIVGYINFNRLGATDPAKKKEALPYFYKVTQIPGENQKEISLYTNIGNWYFDQAAELDKKYRDLRAANNNTDTDESKTVLGMARGYADRAIDSFARARKVAQANKAKPKVMEAVNKTLTDLYKLRFGLAPTAATPDLENYISGLLTKPMPDPATKVEPVFK